MSLVIWIVIVLLLLGLIGFKGYPWVRNYMQRRRERMEIEERYKKLLKTRDDIEYHYHWAKDRGDEKEANNMYVLSGYLGFNFKGGKSWILWKQK